MRWIDGDFSCIICGYTEEVTKKVKTNADRIRRMSDSELAEWLSSLENITRAQGAREETTWIEWLKKPMGGET